MGLCIVYYEQKDYTQAVRYGEKGLKIATESGMKSLIKITSHVLANSYAALGNDEKATMYYKIYQDQNESSNN